MSNLFATWFTTSQKFNIALFEWWEARYSFKNLADSSEPQPHFPFSHCQIELVDVSYSGKWMAFFRMRVRFSGVHNFVCRTRYSFLRNDQFLLQINMFAHLSKR
jgi:hypothetical protein